MSNKPRGFTIVELLIVIVIIAILAAITIVAYNGIQQRARDAQRIQDVKTIAKALEMYYLDNGEFPSHSCGSSCPVPKKGGPWSTTADGSWSVLEAALVPKYLSALPKDPQASLEGQAAQSGGSNYDYARWVRDTCGAGARTFMLLYRLEGQSQKREITGTCPSGDAAHDYALASEYAVIKP